MVHSLSSVSDIKVSSRERIVWTIFGQSTQEVRLLIKSYNAANKGPCSTPHDLLAVGVAS